MLWRADTPTGCQPPRRSDVVVLGDTPPASLSAEVGQTAFAPPRTEVSRLQEGRLWVSGTGLVCALCVPLTRIIHEHQRYLTKGPIGAPRIGS